MAARRQLDRSARLCGAGHGTRVLVLSGEAPDARGAGADETPCNLDGLIDRLDDAAHDQGEVSFETVVRAVGRRSFGPLLVVAGLVAISPIGDIPGGPSTIGLMTLMISVQLLLGRERFWVPGWLARRTISERRFRKALGWLRKPAAFVDRFLRPRLTFMTHAGGAHAIAAVTTLLAIAMVPMELVPFSITAASLVLIAFGLALTAHDGLLALIAFVLLGTTVGVVLYHLL